MFANIFKALSVSVAKLQVSAIYKKVTYFFELFFSPAFHVVTATVHWSKRSLHTDPTLLNELRWVNHVVCIKERFIDPEFEWLATFSLKEKSTCLTRYALIIV